MAQDMNNQEIRQYIDPIYKKYAKRVIETVASTDFYEYFMENIENGKNEFQFSNRKIIKDIDESWVLAIEECMTPFHNIIMNPRNFIREDEEIVNVAVARQSTPDVIRHLTMHGNYIDEVTEDNVRPNHLMNKFKEDTWNTYENRFVYTLLEKTHLFVKKRYEAIFANVGDEYGAFLKMSSETTTYAERVKANIDIRIRENEDRLAGGEKGKDIFERIAKLYRGLQNYMQSSFAKQMCKYARVKNPIVKTNAIQKNPNFKACYILWVFIYNYLDIGYNISIYEQSNEIDQEFMNDIYHSIMFDYIILKNHLENPEDREVDTTRNFRKKKYKPKFLKQIIEEIVENYDMPDVELRKVLIEEITKAQLLKESKAEQKRLVAQKEKEMRERKKAEEKERRRIEREKAKEKARIEKQKALEAEQRLKELQKQEELNEKCLEQILEELSKFEEAYKIFSKKRKNDLKAASETNKKKRERKPKQAAVVKPTEEPVEIIEAPVEIIEEPVEIVEDATVDEPEQPVVQEPEVVEPVIAAPEEPAVEEPVIAEPEEPAVEEPVAAEPEAPTVEEPEMVVEPEAPVQRRSFMDRLFRRR